MAALIVGLHHLSQCGNTLEIIEVREEAWRAACIISTILRGLRTFAPSTAHASLVKV